MMVVGAIILLAVVLLVHAGLPNQVLAQSDTLPPSLITQLYPTPADLSDVVLFGVNLAGAYLVGIDLSGEVLVGANLGGAYLVGANLSGADLSGADLSGAFLNWADLTGADLTGTRLDFADLTGADLTSTNLTGAFLQHADLTAADLTAADLTSAVLIGAYLAGGYLGEDGGLVVDLRGLRLVDADLPDVDLPDVDLADAYLPGDNSPGQDLSGANLQFADFAHQDLAGANLTGADLYGANLYGANLHGADLYGANLRYADLRYADLRYADLRYADLRGLYFELANIDGLELYGADLTGAKIGLDGLKPFGLDIEFWTELPDRYFEASEKAVENAAARDGTRAAVIEDLIHELVNQRRADNGVHAVERLWEADSTALSHSEDMAERGYFSHNTPEGLTPTDRAARSWFGCAAENLALVYGGGVYGAEQLANMMVDGWMDSPGHRQNLLHFDHLHTGIGVAFGDGENVYAVQVFC